MKGAKVLEQESHVVPEFKAKKVDVTKAPKIQVALNRGAKAAYATYKVGARVYGMLADGDWYPAHVIMVRINAMDEEEYDIEYEVKLVAVGISRLTTIASSHSRETIASLPFR